MIERVARLLDEGGQVDARDEMGATALHLAVMGGHAHIVRLLLERGTPVDAQNVHGNTALLLADTLEVVQLLLAAGADPNLDAGCGFTPFLYQARSGKADVLSALIDAGADLQSKSADGRTVLDHAKSNRPDSRRLLKTRMGLAADAIDLLRDEMTGLSRHAKDPGFEAVAEWIGGLLNRQPAPWKRRKGVVYFHNVSVVKHLATRFGQPAGAPDAEQIFTLLGMLEDEVRAKGFTLVYIDSSPDADGRLPWD